MKPRNFPNRREQRKHEAEVRQNARNKRTDEQQLRRLTMGGHGNCKEAQRLRERLTK